MLRTFVPFLGLYIIIDHGNNAVRLPALIRTTSALTLDDIYLDERIERSRKKGTKSTVVGVG